MKRDVLKSELEYLEKDDELQKLVTENVLEIYDILEKQGHSGMSFSYVGNLIKKLLFEDCLIRPIVSFEEDPDDWKVCTSEPLSYQNKRRTSVFYDKDTNMYWDINRCIFTHDDGVTWWTTDGWFKKFKQIKVPYFPDGKKWEIYIEPTIELEPGYGPDDNEYIIKKIEYK